MDTLILLAVVIFLGLRFWPRLRVFSLMWKSPVPRTEITRAVHEPDQEVQHLLDVATAQLQASGYELQFAYDCRVPEGISRWLAFARPERPDTLILVCQPAQPFVREFDFTMSTSLRSPDGSLRTFETAPGILDWGMDDSAETSFSDQIEFDKVAAEHEAWIADLCAQGWRLGPGRSLADHIANYESSWAELREKQLRSGAMVEHDGSLHFTATKAWAVTNRLFQRVAQSQKPGEADAPACIESALQTTAAARCIVDQKVKGAGKPGYAFLFTVSLITSLVAFGLWLGWDFAVIVLAVIFIHELGHWIGMKLCGYEDPRIFFVPMFGGVATGKKDARTVGQELLVLLLGPVPGLVLALAIYWAGGGSTGIPEWLERFLFLTFIINYLNLLPVMPLDGGRVVHALFLRRAPQLGFLFSALSILAMIGGALLLRSWILGLLALLGVMRIRSEHFVGKVHKKTMSSLSAEERGDPYRSTPRVIEVLEQEQLPETLRPFPQRGALINRIVASLQSPPPSLTTTLLGTVAYVVSLVLPVAAGVALILHLEPRQAEAEDPDQPPGIEDVETGDDPLFPERDPGPGGD